MATGDTSWRPVQIRPLYDLKPDVVLAAINGVLGNMNRIDSVRLVSEAKPRFPVTLGPWPSKSRVTPPVLSTRAL
jgi:hypothetical protein